MVFLLHNIRLIYTRVEPRGLVLMVNNKSENNIPNESYSSNETVMECKNITHFYGHVHSTPDKPYICRRNSWDVGVDNNDLAPISLEDAIELAENNKNVFHFGEGNASTELEEDIMNYDLVELD